jgi:hypothetical protein
MMSRSIDNLTFKLGQGSGSKLTAKETAFAGESYPDYEITSGDCLQSNPERTEFPQLGKNASVMSS